MQTWQTPVVIVSFLRGLCEGASLPFRDINITRRKGMIEAPAEKGVGFCKFFWSLDFFATFCIKAESRAEIHLIEINAGLPDCAMEAGLRAGFGFLSSYLLVVV